MSPILLKPFPYCTSESDSKQARLNMLRKGIQPPCANHIDRAAQESPELAGARHDVVRERTLTSGLNR